MQVAHPCHHRRLIGERNGNALVGDDNIARVIPKSRGGCRQRAVDLSRRLVVLQQQPAGVAQQFWGERMPGWSHSDIGLTGMIRMLVGWPTRAIEVIAM
jgi:hypothetical protein